MNKFSVLPSRALNYGEMIVVSAYVDRVSTVGSNIGNFLKPVSIRTLEKSKEIGKQRNRFSCYCTPFIGLFRIIEFIGLAPLRIFAWSDREAKRRLVLFAHAFREFALK